MIPTDSGILSSSIISFILLFLVLAKVAGKSLEDLSDLRKPKLFFLFSLIYFALWLMVIFIGQALFNLNLTPALGKIASFSILTPYFLNVFLYAFGFHLKLRW